MKHNFLILFLRITTRGDPVPGLPKKFGGYQHPCSENEEMRKQISEDCNEMLSVIDVRSGSGSGASGVSGISATTTGVGMGTGMGQQLPLQQFQQPKTYFRSSHTNLRYRKLKIEFDQQLSIKYKQ